MSIEENVTNSTTAPDWAFPDLPAQLINVIEDDVRIKTLEVLERIATVLETLEPIVTKLTTSGPLAWGLGRRK